MLQRVTLSEIEEIWGKFMTQAQLDEITVRYKTSVADLFDLYKESSEN